MNDGTQDVPHRLEDPVSQAVQPTPTATGRRVDSPSLRGRLDDGRLARAGRPAVPAPALSPGARSPGPLPPPRLPWRGAVTEADPGTTLRIYELLDMLRYAEATLLNALGAGRGVDRSLSASTVVELSRVELHDLRSAALDLAERAEADRHGGVEARAGRMRGPPDHVADRGRGRLVRGRRGRRARPTPRCLPARSHRVPGACRHAALHRPAPVLARNDVERSTRPVPQRRPARRASNADLATVSPAARWDDCDRDTITRIALALEYYAAELPRTIGEL